MAQTSHENLATSSNEGLSEEMRSKLALALDVDDLVEAMRLARQLAPWFGVVKVGLELYSAAGPDSVAALLDAGFEVFLDLKLHDIATTVRKASAVAGSLGVSYLTMHAHGGAEMLRAGVEGLYEGARNAGLGTVPNAVAVTLLTTDASAPAHIMPNRLRLAVEAGCSAIVCSGPNLREARELSPRTARVVPGIRAEGAEWHDQVQAVTPKWALAEGADLLVVGRPVTAVEDPVAAAVELFGEL